MFVSIFPQIVTTLAITKAKDQIRPELKRLDPEITLELTDIRFQNDYSTLALRASGNYADFNLQYHRILYNALGLANSTFDNPPSLHLAVFTHWYKVLAYSYRYTVVPIISCSVKQ